MNKKTIADILKSFNIVHWAEGKNVSDNSVNINCPFCVEHGSPDPSNHLGIFEDTLLYSCWRCPARGTFSYLLQRMTGISEYEANKLTGTVTKLEKKREPFVLKEIELPLNFELIQHNTTYMLLEAWMERRNIDWDTVIERRCGICRFGDYANRIIIPIFYQNKVVSFQGADLTGRAYLKYRTAEGEINRFLYNFDAIGDIMIVTEGILDAWRVGKDAVCSFGTHITDTQRDLILSKKPKVLIFCWDGDAWVKGRKEANFFRPFIDKVYSVIMPKDEDPDSFGTDNIHRLIEESII